MDILNGLLVVERAIPPAVLAGLATGEYSLHGGVVRNASGQIVRHLISASTESLNPFGFIEAPLKIFNTYQMHGLKQLSSHILQVSSATMAMSGLGLAVGVVSFAVLHDGLRKVDRQLRIIGEDLKWIKHFLDSERHAALMDAAQDLQSLPSDVGHRNQVLHTHRSKVGQVAMQYLQDWERSLNGSLTEAMAYQHYYCTAFLLKSRCSAELGMFDNARQEIGEGVSSWKDSARFVATEKILKDNPGRFLGEGGIPTAKMIEWMDFSSDAKLGLEWVDHVIGNSGRLPNLSFLKKGSNKFDEEHMIEFMDCLVKRNDVLDGYVSQYEFLASCEVTPSVFEREIASIDFRESANHDSAGVVVLMPNSKLSDSSGKDGDS